MNKFDVVEKVSLSSYWQAFFYKSKDPYKALKKLDIVKNNWHKYYFNFGRNALYFLFKNLPYKTIHFPAFTCSVLTDAAIMAGKKIVLLEVDKQTFNLDLKKLPKSMECLVAVHTFGNPIDIPKIKKANPKTFIIEDCAHALFSKIKGKFVGQFGDAILFSLYKQVPNLNGSLLLSKKSMMVNQKNENLLSFWPRIVFKTKGGHEVFLNKLRKRYINTLEEKDFSFNTSCNTFVKKLFCLQVEKFDKIILKKRAIWFLYKKLFENNKYFYFQKVLDENKISGYQFVVFLKPEYLRCRDKLVWAMRKDGIFLDRLWYSAPITERRFAKFVQSCPNALKLARSVISLPTNTCLMENDIKFLINKLESKLIALND